MKFLSKLSEKEDLADKVCLLRVDLNIGTDAKQRMSVNLRIISVLPTIKFLVQRGAKVVILSHRGRIKRNEAGVMRNEDCKKFTLKPFAKTLSVLLKQPVDFIDFKKEFKPYLVRRSIAMRRHSVFLLENLRFLPGEEKNDKKLAKQLASVADFYVNDAFAVSHRNAASVVAITKFLPAYAGLLLEKEIKNLSTALKKPKKPLVVILGGAKISDKIGLIENFISASRRKAKPRSELRSTTGADYFLMGGGMANTFFAARDLPVGDSLYEKEMIPIARRLLNLAGGKIILPIDTIIDNRRIMDIGPETAKKYGEIIKKSKTIIWNGPMGYCEKLCFVEGSMAIIKAIMKSRAFAIVGGGETTNLVSSIKYQVSSKIFLSTGGGAMLEYLAGKKLPGIKALR